MWIDVSSKVRTHHLSLRLGVKVEATQLISRSCKITQDRDAASMWHVHIRYLLHPAANRKCRKMMEDASWGSVNEILFPLSLISKLAQGEWEEKVEGWIGWFRQGSAVETFLPSGYVRVPGPVALYGNANNCTNSNALRGPHSTDPQHWNSETPNRINPNHQSWKEPQTDSQSFRHSRIAREADAQTTQKDDMGQVPCTMKKGIQLWGNVREINCWYLLIFVFISVFYMFLLFECFIGILVASVELDSSSRNAAGGSAVQQLGRFGGQGVMQDAMQDAMQESRCNINQYRMCKMQCEDRVWWYSTILYDYMIHTMAMVWRRLPWWETFCGLFAKVVIGDSRPWNTHSMLTFDKSARRDCFSLRPKQRELTKSNEASLQNANAVDSKAFRCFHRLSNVINSCINCPSFFLNFLLRFSSSRCSPSTSCTLCNVQAMAVDLNLKLSHVRPELKARKITNCET